jgi:hypothetical protein
VGLWPLPELDERDTAWSVEQNPQVAGSAGLRAATDGRAYCTASGSPTWTGQPQRRLSEFAAKASDSLYWAAEVNICEPQSFAQTVGDANLWGTGTSVMDCLWPDPPKLRPDGRPDCLANKFTWSQVDMTDGPDLPQCSPGCCAAMPSKRNLDWSRTWDNATVRACMSEPVDCFCVTPTAYCPFGDDMQAAGVWLAGNAAGVPYSAVEIRCATQNPLDAACQTP